MNDKLDTGLKLLMSVGSRLDFLSNGVTTASFILSGTVQLTSDELIKCVKNSTSKCTDCLGSQVGIGSSRLGHYHKHSPGEKGFPDP
jgi:hypothetical protein